MDRWFDLHLYWANWGTRRLMLRLPKRFVDRPGLARGLTADFDRRLAAIRGRHAQKGRFTERLDGAGL